MAAIFQAAPSPCRPTSLSCTTPPKGHTNFTCQKFEGHTNYSCRNIRGSFSNQDRKDKFWKILQKGLNGWECRKSTAMKDRIHLTKATMHDDISGVALGPNETYHILFQDGRQAWRDLPTVLYNKLNGRAYNLPGVSFVSLGPQGEWFVKFEDEKCYWGGPTTSEFDLSIKDDDFNVESVTFGPNQTWFVRFSDGYADTDGLPQPHKNRIASLKQNGHTIERVALGSNGDWWMLFDTGHARFYSADKDIMDWLSNDNRKDIVVFGCDENFVVICDSSLDYWRVNKFFDEAVGFEGS